VIGSWTLGGDNEKPVPINSLKELERERCSVTKSWMLGGGDREPVPTNIWDGVADLVNRNMFTHYH